jgi:hypothetical protein
MADMYKMAFFGLIALFLIIGIWFVTTQKNSASSYSDEVVAGSNNANKPETGLFGYELTQDQKIDSTIRAMNNDGTDMLILMKKYELIDEKYDLTKESTFTSECVKYYGEYKTVSSGMLKTYASYFSDMNDLALLLNEGQGCKDKITVLKSKTQKMFTEAILMSDKWIDRWCYTPTVAESEFESAYGISIWEWMDQATWFEQEFNQTITYDCPKINARLEAYAKS